MRICILFFYFHCLGDLESNELEEFDRAYSEELFVDGCKDGTNLALKIVFHTLLSGLIGTIPYLLETP